MDSDETDNKKTSPLVQNISGACKGFNRQKAIFVTYECRIRKHDCAFFIIIIIPSAWNWGFV